MEFNIEKASDWDYKRKVEIKTIEDLENLNNEYKKEIEDINSKIDSNSPFDYKGYDGLIIDFYNKTITVYDAYVE